MIVLEDSFITRSPPLSPSSRLTLETQNVLLCY